MVTQPYREDKQLSSCSPRQKSNIILLRISTALPRSKRCSAELPLRAGLIRATQTYQVFMHLRCAYELCGEVLCFKRSNTTELRNETMFGFYPIGEMHVRVSIISIRNRAILMKVHVLSKQLDQYRYIVPALAQTLHAKRSQVCPKHTIWQDLLKNAILK